MDDRAPNGGAREITQGAKGVSNPIGGTTIQTNQYPPELVSLAEYVLEDGLVGIIGKRGPLVLQSFYASVRGNARAKMWEWVGNGVGERSGGLLG
jgi:hypothetical protein